MQLHIQVGSTAEVGVELAQIAGRIAQRLEPEMIAATAMLRGHIVDDKLSGDPLKARSGRLRSSITSEVSTNGNESTGLISTAVPYARIQEFGGTIIARGAANLTIPLAAVLGAQGEARFSARELIANPALGGFLGTFVRKQILFGKDAGGAITPLFKLQASVEIPSRSFFRSALVEKRSEILDLFRTSVANAF